MNAEIFGPNFKSDKFKICVGRVSFDAPFAFNVGLWCRDRLSA